uniref:Ubiquitin conjugating enzyme E2 E2 n=2 Tax=Equus TaxID=9789 RepID=A0A9L0TRA9_HORSE
MSTEAQRVDDSPSTSGGSSDGDQRESVQQEPEREQVQPKKKEGKISSKTAAKLSTSAKRIQKELAEITLDPPPNCRYAYPCYFCSWPYFFQREKQLLFLVFNKEEGYQH